MVRNLSRGELATPRVKIYTRLGGSHECAAEAAVDVPLEAGRRAGGNRAVPAQARIMPVGRTLESLIIGEKDTNISVRFANKRLL